VSLDTDIVVVGAGPTGLTLALQVSKVGSSVRIIERRNTPRPWAPALAIHPRTMEILRGLGAADELLTRGLSKVDLRINVDGSTVVGSLGDLHLPTTEYPFIFFAPQPEVERVLRQRLATFGVEVEWGCELKDLVQGDGGVVCRLEVAGEERRISARYLVGCDGADSTVRNESGIGFLGRSYRESILIADTANNKGLEAGAAHAFLGAEGVLFFFPLPSGGWRLIGPCPAGETPADVWALVDHHTRGAVELGDVSWIKVITPQHRLAETYRRERAFLAGDAAHVHSPAGAQGMNTGIQDAANLGWKIGLAVRGSPDSLLETYETERRPVARQVVRLTGFAYALEVSAFAPLRWGRRWAAAPIAGLLLPHPRLTSVVARAVSGLDTRYRHGAIDHCRFPWHRLGAGRRLPDGEIISGQISRLHRHIDAGGFHLLVSGSVSQADEDLLSASHPDIVRVHRPGQLTSKSWGRIGWALVRPDGYIASSGEAADLGDADRYLRRWLGQLGAARSGLQESNRNTALR
jgi:2-polyprenyl-6-methoxyphenol hydroxylase-like FAD-dependent oxidoreductase